MSREGQRFLKCNIGCFLNFVDRRRILHVIQYSIELGVNLFGSQFKGTNHIVELVVYFALVVYFNPNHFETIINCINGWYRDGWTRLRSSGWWAFFCGSVVNRSGGNATSPLWLIQDSFFGRGWHYLIYVGRICNCIPVCIGGIEASSIFWVIDVPKPYALSIVDEYLSSFPIFYDVTNFGVQSGFSSTDKIMVPCLIYCYGYHCRRVRFDLGEKLRTWHTFQCWDAFKEDVQGNAFVIFLRYVCVEVVKAAYTE